MELRSDTNSARHQPVSDWLACLLLLSVLFTLYSQALYFGFVWDDTAYIAENYRIQSLDLPHIRSFLAGTYLGHYAPVHHMFLALVYAVGGNVPFPFHAANLAIHMLAVVMLYYLLKRVESGRVALLACLLYVVHPTHPETVAWISESKSTLSFLLLLLSVWFFLRFRENSGLLPLALSMAFYVLSALTKINTVVLPAIFLLYEYRNSKSFRDMNWRMVGLFAVVSLGLVAVHLLAFGHGDEMLDGMKNSPFAVRFMNLPLLLSFYLDTMLVPYNLSVWEQLPVQPAFTWLVGLAWAGLAIMLILLTRVSRQVQFWVGWFVVFLLPILQFVPFPIWVADRYLYIPLVGGCVLLAKLFSWTWDRLEQERAKWAMAAGFALAVFLLAWQTHLHVPIWKDDLSLWGTTVLKCRLSPYCRSSHGMALMAVGKLQQGGDELVEAVRLRPAPIFLAYLGDALTLSARNYPEAIKVYTLAVKNAPKPGEDPNAVGTGTIYAKLARAYIKQGELDHATESVRRGAAYYFANPMMATADTFLQWKRGDLEAARGSLEALRIMISATSNIDAYVDRFWANSLETQQMLRDLRSGGIKTGG